jgi:tetratricopeptide (TPR) repeat protein
LNPEKPYYNLGNVYYRQGLYEKALRAYKSAVLRRPEFHLPYYGMALSYNMLKRYGDAADALEQAIKLDPVIKGDRDRAEEFFKQMKLKATDPAVEQDYNDLLDILYY